MGVLEKVLGKRKLNKSQKSLWITLEFLIRLLILAIPLYIIIVFGISLIPLQVSVASQSAFVLEGMGYDVQYSHIFLSASLPSDETPFVFMINEDCTGWKSMFFLFALVFAVPGITLNKRIWGLIIGLPLIWIVNLARVVGVVIIESNYGLTTAMLVHDYLWQIGLIITVLVIWLSWLRWARKRPAMIAKIRRMIKW